MRLLLVLFLFVVPVFLPMDASATTNKIEADNADYDGKKIRMVGSVRIQHEFGNIKCDKSELIMKVPSELAVSEKNKGRTLDRIMLSGSVEVVLHDGSVLTSDEADINCQTLEGVFTAAAPQKVVYITRVEEDGRAVPVKTMSRSMRVTMKKQDVVNEDGQLSQKAQYVINDVQADGAVNIEYQQEN